MGMENQTGMGGRHIYYEYLLPFTLLWYYIFSFRFPYIETKISHEFKAVQQTKQDSQCFQQLP